MKQKPIKILLVDDDANVRGTYAVAFEKSGFEVIESADGLDGLASAIALLPDIIFTGIIMPRMDGFTFMQELKKNTKTARIPVVISSHLGREEDRKRAEELGAKDFFIKDSDQPEEVAKKVALIITQGNYYLKFDEKLLDGPRFLEDLKKGEGLLCPKCQKEKVLRIKVYDFEKGEFSGKLNCPECEK